MRLTYKFTDGVSNSTTTYTSATAVFASADVGHGISGTNIPAGTTIVSRTNATTIILSQAATGTGSGLTFTIEQRLPLSAKVGKLPFNYEFIPSLYRKLFLQRARFYFSGEDVFLGSTESTEPLRNTGAWFTSGSLYAWRESIAKYTPADIGFVNEVTSGGATRAFGMSIVAAPTEGRILTLPDSDGTALLVTDVTVPKETVTLTGTTPTIDASLSNNFFLTLEGDTTIQPLENMTSGKKIRIGIANNGTAYTVTWPSAGTDEIKWPVSPSHTQPTSAPGQPVALGIYSIHETGIGIDAHLWGDPEADGFNAPVAINPGGDVPPEYDPLPPPRGIRPFDVP